MRAGAGDLHDIKEEAAIFSHHQEGRSSRYGGGFGSKYHKLLLVLCPRQGAEIMFTRCRMVSYWLRSSIIDHLYSNTPQSVLQICRHILPIMLKKSLSQA